MSISFTPVDLGRREPVALEVARRLLDYLLSGEIAPGDRMPSERQLAQVLGVGRSAVREAITALALLGLVDVRQGDGTYLKRIDSGFPIDTIEWGMLLGTRRTRDLVEARRHLEIVAAGLAAARRDETVMGELRRLVGGMEAAQGDLARFVVAEGAFHRCLADATGNEVIARMLASIRQLLGDGVAAGPDYVAPSLAEHRAVLAAIAAGDATGAQAAMGACLDGVAARLAVSVGKRGQGEEAHPRGIAESGRPDAGDVSSRRRRDLGNQRT